MKWSFVGTVCITALLLCFLCVVRAENTPAQLDALDAIAGNCALMITGHAATECLCTTLDNCTLPGFRCGSLLPGNSNYSIVEISLSHVECQTMPTEFLLFDSLKNLEFSAQIEIGSEMPDFSSLTHLLSLELLGLGAANLPQPYLDFQVTGTLPRAWPPNLQQLSVAGYGVLSGTIPAELDALQYLETVTFYNLPAVSGVIPAAAVNSLIAREALWQLRITGTKMNGTLDGVFPVSRPKNQFVQVDLSSNQLSGTMPEALVSQQWKDHAMVDLRGNNFDCPIQSKYHFPHFVYDLCMRCLLYSAGKCKGTPTLYTPNQGQCQDNVMPMNAHLGTQCTNDDTSFSVFGTCNSSSSICNDASFCNEFVTGNSGSCITHNEKESIKCFCPQYKFSPYYGNSPGVVGVACLLVFLVWLPVSVVLFFFIYSARYTGWSSLVRHDGWIGAVMRVPSAPTTVIFIFIFFTTLLAVPGGIAFQHAIKHDSAALTAFTIAVMCIVLFLPSFTSFCSIFTQSPSSGSLATHWLICLMNLCIVILTMLLWLAQIIIFSVSYHRVFGFDHYGYLCQHSSLGDYVAPGRCKELKQGWEAYLTGSVLQGLLLLALFVDAIIRLRRTSPTSDAERDYKPVNDGSSGSYQTLSG